MGNERKRLTVELKEKCPSLAFRIWGADLGIKVSLGDSMCAVCVDPVGRLGRKYHKVPVEDGVQSPWVSGLVTGFIQP